MSEIEIRFKQIPPAPQFCRDRPPPYRERGERFWRRTDFPSLRQLRQGRRPLVPADLSAAHLPGFTTRNFLTFPDSLNLLLMDNGRHHTAETLDVPKNVRRVFLRPYSPELSPIETPSMRRKSCVAPSYL